MHWCSVTHRKRRADSEFRVRALLFSSVHHLEPFLSCYRPHKEIVQRVAYLKSTNRYISISKVRLRIYHEFGVLKS